MQKKSSIQIKGYEEKENYTKIETIEQYLCQVTKEFRKKKYLFLN
jgi:hypothetical protein